MEVQDPTRGSPNRPPLRPLLRRARPTPTRALPGEVTRISLAR
jgi:hypothetical protein